MEPIECQYNNNCGGWCETNEEREMNLCADCLEAEREEDREREINHERMAALQRIAVAAGIELAAPSEVADIVCAMLKTPNAEAHRGAAGGASGAAVGCASNETTE